MIQRTYTRPVHLEFEKAEKDCLYPVWSPAPVAIIDAEPLQTSRAPNANDSTYVHSAFAPGI